ncbi:hypothetical protein PIB30_051190 [Stylosanthes scabra]|uniref:Transmembrane protein n=1 Tax=Stylosanthes scabra TaxID=79078 RepID=A0ABU6WI81_9FABA|nr:hypothetical protein [Stylosanthes scabra]
MERCEGYRAVAQQRCNGDQQIKGAEVVAAKERRRWQRGRRDKCFRTPAGPSKLKDRKYIRIGVTRIELAAPSCFETPRCGVVVAGFPFSRRRVLLTVALIPSWSCFLSLPRRPTKAVAFASTYTFDCASAMLPFFSLSPCFPSRRALACASPSAAGGIEKGGKALRRRWYLLGWTALQACATMLLGRVAGIALMEPRWFEKETVARHCFGSGRGGRRRWKVAGAGGDKKTRQDYWTADTTRRLDGGGDDGV